VCEGSVYLAWISTVLRVSIPELLTTMEESENEGDVHIRLVLKSPDLYAVRVHTIKYFLRRFTWMRIMTRLMMEAQDDLLVLG
jgi:hypothetical protein